MEFDDDVADIADDKDDDDDDDDVDNDDANDVDGMYDIVIGKVLVHYITLTMLTLSPLVLSVFLHNKISISLKKLVRI